MKKILKSVEGIGEKKSDKLIKKFGVDGLVKMLETAPEKLKEELVKKIIYVLDEKINYYGR